MTQKGGLSRFEGPKRIKFQIKPDVASGYKAGAW
jgi:hypothetical protein